MSYESADAVARLMSVDDSDESLANMNPIFGVDEAPDLSFIDAMAKANVRKERTISHANHLTAIYAPPACSRKDGVKYHRSPRTQPPPFFVGRVLTFLFNLP